MGSSTIFIILALIIWGASRYMKKSWDIDEEETTPYEPEIPEAQQQTAALCNLHLNRLFNQNRLSLRHKSHSLI